MFDSGGIDFCKFKIFLEIQMRQTKHDLIAFHYIEKMSCEWTRMANLRYGMLNSNYMFLD